MISRLMLLAAALGASIGLPYVMSTEFRGGQKSHSESTPETSSGSAAQAPGAAGSHAVIPSHATEAVATRQTTGAASVMPYGSPTTPSMPFEEVFNFNATPAWILSRWPRVSAGLPELDYQGYRVTLVSGVRPDDLAGSLTYYFDSTQHVARITFQGTTGDPSRLVTMVTSRFGFVRVMSEEPGQVLYSVKWNNRRFSDLSIRTASVVRASTPRSAYEIELNLKRL